jgi:hypothetical protein
VFPPESIFLPLVRSFALASGAIKGRRATQKRTLRLASRAFAVMKDVTSSASAMLILGERRMTADMIGFALIFAAAVCAMTQQGRKPAPQTP